MNLRIIILCLSIVFIGSIGLAAKSFKQEQQKYPRVRQARINTQDSRDSLFRAAGLNDSLYRIYLRAFKHERLLELWARNDTGKTFKHLKNYKFTAFCGDLGPKRYQGDLQIPEGFYHVDRFNPHSSYHLSLGINYPNRSDRIRKTRDNPGGDIFIHGNRVTIGCIPIGDKAIEELYIIAVDAKSSGQTMIPVHIFPYRLNDSVKADLFIDYIINQPELDSFWKELNPIYKYFERNYRLPDITIDEKGRYRIDSLFDMKQ